MTTIALGGGGEFDRIREIAVALGDAATGLGDDCAVIPAGAGELVVSTDVSVEEVHFRRAWMSAEEIGWRSVAAALSDLAAAAAQPVGIVVAVVVPRQAPHPDVVAVMRGAGAAASSVGARVLGGDLSTGEMWMIAVTVLGRAERRMSRAGATRGDRVWVTGTLGGARAAFEAWSAGHEPEAAARQAFAHPVPQVAAARWLAEHGATAMMDISDGLAGDLEHLAAASGVGIEIDLAAVPRHPSVDAMAAAIGEEPEVFAATGGEDYELLFTMPAAFDPPPPDRSAGGIAITPIGVIVGGNGVRTTLRGAPRTLQGFRHPV